MKLTAEQRSEVQKIMAEMDCPKSFRCYESGFEDLTTVQVISSNGLVECHGAGKSLCPLSARFGFDWAFCRCPLRKYVAVTLGR
jgi:hypothetical protein